MGVAFTWFAQFTMVLLGWAFALLKVKHPRLIPGATYGLYGDRGFLNTVRITPSGLKSACMVKLLCLWVWICLPIYEEHAQCVQWGLIFWCVSCVRCCKVSPGAVLCLCLDSWVVLFPFRTKRILYPNVQRKTYFSKILDVKLQIRVTTNAMRCIDKAGGFDHYIYHTPPKRLSKLGNYLRQEMLKTIRTKKLEPPRKVGRLHKPPKSWEEMAKTQPGEPTVETQPDKEMKKWLKLSLMKKRLKLNPRLSATVWPWQIHYLISQSCMVTWWLFWRIINLITVLHRHAAISSTNLLSMHICLHPSIGMRPFRQLICLACTFVFIPLSACGHFVN